MKAYLVWSSLSERRRSRNEFGFRKVNRIITGDILRFAAHYKGERFHGVLCDPPYELGFMGKSWDSRGISFSPNTWSAIRSLLVPGAHLLAFGGTRTFHRIAIAIEDAGFEIRDTLGWLYGSGFPKSHDVSKAIDREAGVEREVVSTPATDAARAWQGYGTALKPAWEPVIVARNPLSGTVAQNVMEHGAGALNIDGGRVSTEEELRRAVAGWRTVYVGGEQNYVNTFDLHPEGISGRWPANIIHDGSDEIAEVMGDAQRFFYCAKAGKRERDEGLGEFSPKQYSHDGRETSIENPYQRNSSLARNHHPTVKPLALTEYLATLIVPPAHVESRLLVPFAGSGSECIGAIRAGWNHVVGVEMNQEYADIARARIYYHQQKLTSQNQLSLPRE